MEASNNYHEQLGKSNRDNLQESMGSLLLKSKLPREFQSWVPQELLGLPYALSRANKQLLHGKYGITELHWASLTGLMDYATDLLNRGVNVNSVTLNEIKASAPGSNEIGGVTALYLAARSGHMRLVEVLLEHGAGQDILKRGRMGDTALHAAALSGKDGVVKLLINSLPKKDRGSRADGHENPVDMTDCEKRTPLHYAAGGGHEDVVRVLMEWEASSRSARDANGATPFHFAAGWGNSIPALEMLMMGQQVDEATDNNGRTALHYAASKGQLGTVKWLLENGASINACDSLNGDTPLHLAARHPEVIHALANSGADICLPNWNGDLALALAHAHKNAMAVKVHLKAIQQLPEDVVDKLTKRKHGKEGATLLHYFSAYGTAADVDWILGFSAFNEDTSTGTGGSNTHASKRDTVDNAQEHSSTGTGGSNTGTSKINAVDDAGQTAVHWAAVEGNADALRVLVKRLADLNVVDKEHRSVLCLAISHSKDMEFVNTFLGLPFVKFDQVQKWVTHEEARMWMKEYYSVNNILEGGMKKYMRLKSLSGQGRSTDYINPLDELPPIFLALHAGREDVATFMQQHIKGTSAQDAVNKKGEKTGRTALHWATICGKGEIVRKLLSPCKLFAKVLKPNVEDKYGKTALQYAKEMNQAAIEKELMERADVRAHLEGLYRDRQVYVDASNAILVAAALIASVTFAGWLQPPLNYTTYYDLPPLTSPPAPPATFPSYAAVQQHIGVRVFWAFNSLSFIFAIATVLAGLAGVFPISGRYIASTVLHLRRTLWVASAMLALSILCVLGAFAAAGFTVLPPIYRYQANMMGTVIVGGIPCILLLAWFVRSLLPDRQPPGSHSPFSSAPPPPPLPSPWLSSSRPWETESNVFT